MVASSLPYKIGLGRQVQWQVLSDVLTVLTKVKMMPSTVYWWPELESSGDGEEVVFGGM